MKYKKGQGPPMGAPEKVAQWFDETDVSEVISRSRSAQPTQRQKPERTVLISLRLPERLLANLKTYAEGQGASYQRLIKQWVSEGLESAVAEKAFPIRLRPSRRLAKPGKSEIDLVIHSHLMALENELRELLRQGKGGMRP